MYGYKVQINSLPKLVWACETTVRNYEWQNRNSRDMLEISFSKFDTKTTVIDDRSYILKNSALSCVMSNEKRKACCEAEKPITIVSVAVRFPDFVFEPCRINETDLRDQSTLLLPAFLEDLPLSDEIDLIKTLHEIIKLSSKASEPETVAFTSVFFKLLYKIDRITRNQRGDKNKNANYYIKKTNYLIESKFREKITLQTVASELNISPIYLSAMYKEKCGINFSEQLLNVRMKHAEKLLIDQNIPTAKIADLCGFCDDHYFRKKFKQFFGMSVREYRQIKNGLTLYHKSPQKR